MGRALGLSLLLLVLGGCGFQPRGSVVMPSSLKAVRVEAVEPYGPLAEALRTALSAAGISVVDDPAHASARLQVQELGVERRVLSVDSSGHANEYEMHYGLRFTLRTGAGDILLPTQELSQVRDFAFSANNALASDEEQAVVVEEMRRDAVAALLRRLRRAPVQAPAAP